MVLVTQIKESAALGSDTDTSSFGWLMKIPKV